MVFSYVFDQFVSAMEIMTLPENVAAQTLVMSDSGLPSWVKVLSTDVASDVSVQIMDEAIPPFLRPVCFFVPFP